MLSCVYSGIHFEEMTKEQVICILKDTLEYAKEKDKEIEKLNNIINELEKGIEYMWVDNAGEDTWEYEEEACLNRKEFLDKIKELKKE